MQTSFGILRLVALCLVFVTQYGQFCLGLYADIYCSVVIWKTAGAKDYSRVIGSRHYAPPGESTTSVNFIIGQNYTYEIWAYTSGCEKCDSTCLEFFGGPWYPFLYVKIDGGPDSLLNNTWVKYSIRRRGDSPSILDGHVRFSAASTPSTSSRAKVKVCFAVAGVCIRNTIAEGYVLAGPPAPNLCVGWFPITQQFVKNYDVALFQVRLSDRFGNTISGETTFVNPLNYLVLKILGSPKNVQPLYTPKFNITQCRVGACQGNIQISWAPSYTSGDQWLWVGIAGSQSTPIRGSPFLFVIIPDSIAVPFCTGAWDAPINVFSAGQVVSFTITKRFQNNETAPTPPYSFSVSIVYSDGEDPATFAVQTVPQQKNKNSTQSICFTPTRAAKFLLQVGSKTESIQGSPFEFRVTAGPIDYKACTASWKGKNEFIAGEMAVLELVLRDVYGNVVSFQNGGQPVINSLQTRVFQSERYLPTSFDPNPVLVTNLLTGVITIEFRAKVAGNMSLQVDMNGIQAIGNTPIRFVVLAGPVYASACSCSWRYNDSSFEAGTLAIVDVRYVDKYYNAANDTLTFNTSFRKYTGQYVSPPTVEQNAGLYTGFVTLSFYPTLAGIFLLSIQARKQNVSNSPLLFLVSAAGVSIQNSISQWLNSSRTWKAGHVQVLRVWLRDTYGNNVSQENFFVGDLPILEVKVTSLGNKNSSAQQYFNVSSNSNATAGYQDKILQPKVVGYYQLEVGDAVSNVVGSPLIINIVAGKVVVPKCSASWVNGSIFQAGSLATIQVVLRDAYNNVVDNLDGTVLFNAIAISNLAGSSLYSRNLSAALNRSFRSITFWTNSTGSFQISIGTVKENISNSPLYFKVLPGEVNIQKSYGRWLNGVNVFDVRGTANFALKFMDSLQNAVIIKEEDLPKLGISIGAMKNSTQSFLSLSNLTLNPPVNGATEQLLTFSLSTSGYFLLIIRQGGNSLPGSPFPFQYMQGEVNYTLSDVYGDGLRDSFAGNMSIFYIQLRDKKGYPTSSSDSHPEVSIIKSGSFIPLNMSIHYDREKMGLYECRYMAITSGNYSITAKWRGHILGLDRVIYKYVFPGAFYLPNTRVNSIGLGGTAGSDLNITIFTQDRYNNPIRVRLNISLQLIPPTNFSYHVFSNFGQINITYNITKSQVEPYSLSMMIKNEGLSIPGSPFKLMIVPGPFSPSHSTGTWEEGANNYQVGSTAKFIITHRDVYGNAVAMKNNFIEDYFSIRVSKSGLSSYLTIENLKVVPIGYPESRQQRITFNLTKPGEYLLQIGSNTSILLGSPFPFSYFTGTPDTKLTLITGNGLENSTAGDISSFLIQCRDKYGNAVDAFANFISVTVNSSKSKLKVNVSSVSGFSGLINVSYQAFSAGEYSIKVQFLLSTSMDEFNFQKFVLPGPVSFEMSKVSGQGLQGGISGIPTDFDIILVDQYGNRSPAGLFRCDVTILPNLTVSVDVTEKESGVLSVSYTITLARSYSIHIILESEAAQWPIKGSPFTITINPGPVDMKYSKVGGFGLTPLARKNISNDVVACLKDSYQNPTKGDISRLNMILYTNFPADIENFTFNGINAYVSSYIPRFGGSYTIVVSYNNVTFQGMPYTVSIRSDDQGQVLQTLSISLYPNGKLYAGEKALVNIKTSELSYSNYELNFTIIVDPSPWTASTIIQAKTLENVTYLATVRITVAGSYRLYVSFFEKIVGQVPQILVVDPGNHNSGKDRNIRILWDKENILRVDVIER